jgi:hypothetical protein
MPASHQAIFTNDPAATMPSPCRLLRRSLPPFGLMQWRTLQIARNVLRVYRIISLVVPLNAGLIITALSAKNDRIIARTIERRGVSVPAFAGTTLWRLRQLKCFVIARSTCDKAIQSSLNDHLVWIASLRSQ